MPEISKEGNRAGRNVGRAYGSQGGFIYARAGRDTANACLARAIPGIDRGQVRSALKRSAKAAGARRSRSLGRSHPPWRLQTASLRDAWGAAGTLSCFRTFLELHARLFRRAPAIRTHCCNPDKGIRRSAWQSLDRVQNVSPEHTILNHRQVPTPPAGPAHSKRIET